VYFKSLELIGFKSFAEKTTLEFEPGVTAVVGPNGCGKSNVSDAIRWVLGEQSAKTMRGNSMEDVIFNGTATRDPVNFAEVSLTLSNSSKLLPIEYDEVTISRRLYRSGESEYMINRNVIRLKDIQDLLMGTGLGISNYSVIEQGKIDILVSARPELRRELFDEVAGITRFKSKKREALRKLELTEQNLTRVTDIVAEVRRQINSIERQAKKAENYKRDFDRLKRYDLRHARTDREALVAKKDELLSRIEESRRGSEGSEVSLQEINRLLRESRENLSEAEKSFADVKTRQALLDSNVKNSLEKKALYEERIEENKQKSQSLGTDLERNAARIDELNLERIELSARYEAVLSESELGAEALRKSEEGYAEVDRLIREALSSVSEAKNLLVEIATRRAHAQNEITKAESSIQNLTSRRHRLDVEKEKVFSEWNDVKTQYEAISTEVEQFSQEIRAKISEKESLEHGFEQVQHSLKVNREKLKEISHETSSAESRLEVLRDITSKHEGFSQGVRHLLDEARSNELIGRGVVGALADLVEVDRGYELALETALLSYAQSVVCLTHEDVLTAARLLKDTGKGQATFICVEGDPGDQKAAQVFFQDSEVRPLSDFTRSNPRISKCFDRLVEHVYLAKSLEQALQLRRQNPNLAFVTTRGELVRRDMVIGGGHEASDESLLFGRESRIKELKARVMDLTLEKDRLIQKEAELTVEEAQLVEAIREYGISLPKLQVQLADTSAKQEHLGKLKTKLDDELSVVDLELAETEEEMNDLKTREATLKSELEAFVSGARTAEETLHANQSLAEEKLAAKETLLIEITKLGSAQESLNDRTERAKRDLERVDEALGLERESGESMSAERHALAERTKQLVEQIRLFVEAAESGEAEREKLLEANRSIVEERDGWVMKVEDLEAQKSLAEEEMLGAQKNTHDLQIELNSSEHDLERLQERILVNYQVDLTQPVEELVAPSTEGEAVVEAAEAILQSDETAREEDPIEIDLLREKIAKMGPVNLVAIEEHEELRKRYEFLTQQHNDLNTAKDDIHKAILKINRQTREMFADAFTKIQSAFVEYYKLLFGGGTAELILLDENDVLESGIEIVARPPGKKLQSISLLSGGEKAMTAIALLFAVLKVKPSPFVILDEIDAPLDELNVQRFTSVLHEFVKGSQFIIITHNKRTMALADVLYGVTMQQTGMSRIVSVKFGTDKEMQTLDIADKGEETSPDPLEPEPSAASKEETPSEEV